MFSLVEEGGTSSGMLSWSASETSVEFGQFQLVKGLCTSCIGGESFSENETVDDKEEESDVANEWFLSSRFDGHSLLSRTITISSSKRAVYGFVETPPLYLMQHSWKVDLA